MVSTNLSRKLTSGATVHDEFSVKSEFSFKWPIVTCTKIGLNNKVIMLRCWLTRFH